MIISNLKRHGLICLFTLVLSLSTGCLEPLDRTAATTFPVTVATRQSETSATTTPSSTSTAVSETTAKTTAEPPDPLTLLINGMRDEEKVGQLLIGGYRDLEEAESIICELHLGGVLLLGHNIQSEEQAERDIRHLQALVPEGSPHLFIAVDQEGGRVSRLPDTCGTFESARNVGLRRDTAYAREFGERTGRALAGLGFNINLAPVLDIDSNPENTVIDDRAYGKTAEDVIKYALPVLSGLQSQGILTAVKHFPGHGGTVEDSHQCLPVLSKTLDELRSFELKPFAAAITRRDTIVMVAHILLPELDDKPASLSPVIVDELLRQEMCFDGLVMTDDLVMRAITDQYSLEEACVLAVEAGCDLLLVSSDADRLRDAGNALVAAMQDGRLSRERIELSLRRILARKP